MNQQNFGVEPSSLRVEPNPSAALQINQVSAGDEEVALTTDFIPFLCCAFTCSKNDYSKDFGCKSGGSCLCFEYRSDYYRVLPDDPKACMLCASESLECVYPKNLFRDYRQCCCFECFAQFPIPNGGIKRLPELTKERDIMPYFPPPTNVLFCCAPDCCTYLSINCDWCSWIGYYSKGVQLCVEFENVAMEGFCCGKKIRDPRTLYICYKRRATFVKPYTCWSCYSRYGLLDCRSAFPCDPKLAPCVCSPCYCCTACVNGKCDMNCCQTMGQIVGDHNYGNGNGLPAEQQVQPHQIQSQEVVHPLQTEVVFAEVVSFEMTPSSAPVK